MLVLRSVEDLKNNEDKVWKSASKEVKRDLQIIEECYEETSDKYGPMVILIEESEDEKMKERFPLITELETEGEDVISSEEECVIVRNLYLINDEGYVVYTRKKA